ncbi:Cysteine-rich secretory protein 2 [Branchiostoma belcheri]|nr:Cysteine-rich secretory protein 2 [Branchiostoma belcheri]
MKVALLSVCAFLVLGWTEAATNVTARQAEEILGHHNFLRRTTVPTPANMLPLVWNDQLADQAQEWALNCSIEHGYPARPNSTFGTHVGQNIWPISTARFNLTEVVQSWYDEIDFYNWEETKCYPPPDGMCTHYTQVVWASTTAVGCGYQHCPNGQSIVVCNYGPQGNLANTRPYLAGPPCSQCPSGDGWCDQGFCDCPLHCKNCGVLDPATCTCSCKDGWDSPDCSVPCENGHRYCGANPGWPIPAYCTMAGFEVVNDYCREMCGHCEFATPDDPNACCGGQMCYNGGYLDETTCRCVCPHGFGGTDCTGNVADCPLQCKNCGVLDLTTCTCSCADGWDGPDCSVPCENSHPLCGANPGWPTAAYCTMDGLDVVNDFCREMCGHCNFATPGDPNACCVGQMCYNGGYLNTTTCTCVCPHGFGGKDCNYFDGCASNPCFSGGTCVNQDNDFICVCPEGVGGKRCETARFGTRHPRVPNGAQSPGTVRDTRRVSQTVPGHGLGQGHRVSRTVRDLRHELCPVRHGSGQSPRVPNCAQSPGTVWDTLRVSQIMPRHVSFAGGCYQFSSDAVSHSDAERACSTKNSHLADVKNTYQQNTISNGIATTTNASYWLGMKLQAAYTLTYSDGSDAPVPLQFASQRPSHCDLCVYLDSSPYSSNSTDPTNTAPCTEQHNYVCESGSKPCEPNVCQNGGNCTSCFDASICECPGGFEGMLCEINVDECASSPCQHGGTCYDRINSYVCHCESGYMGDSCESDLDWCSLVTCPFYWTCQDAGTHFTCLAPPPNLRMPEFYGCGSAPCPDGMYCREVDESGSFSCRAD